MKKGTEHTNISISSRTSTSQLTHSPQQGGPRPPYPSRIASYFSWWHVCMVIFTMFFCLCPFAVCYMYFSIKQWILRHAILMFNKNVFYYILSGSLHIFLNNQNATWCFMVCLQICNCIMMHTDLPALKVSHGGNVSTMITVTAKIPTTCFIGNTIPISVYSVIFSSAEQHELYCIYWVYPTHCGWTVTDANWTFRHKRWVSSLIWRHQHIEQSGCSRGGGCHRKMLCSQQTSLGTPKPSRRL